ncbi:MAG: hypothetical protein AB2L14_24880 [Candidatus Xenobiia bacterium LiM19]
MRKSSHLRIYLCLVLFFLSVLPGYGEEKWNQWEATDTVLEKGNMGVRSQISGGQRLLDDLCTLNTLGLNIIVFADAGSSHNLRTWLLTKGFSYICGSPTFVPLPGSVWQGNSDEPAVLAVGSQGFCCLSEDPPPASVYPFLQNNIYQNILAGDYLYRVSVGSVPETLDSYLKNDLDMIPSKWAAIKPPEDPVKLSAKKVAIMDKVLSSGDEANTYAFIYRSKGIKTLSSFTSWFRGRNGGGGTNSYCQFSMPWPVAADIEFFRKKYDECSSLRDTLSFCDVTSPDSSGLLSLEETHYRAVLGAGWKASPAFCFHSYDISRNCNAAYEGLWLDDSLMNAFPQIAPPPGSEEPVKAALEDLMENLRTSRRNYVSQFIVSDQESSLKLELNDLYGNRIAAMGDSIDPPSGAKLKLTVDYQNLTPKSNLVMENASLVVIYQYRSGQTHAREVSFTGLHNPVRNYIFTRHSGKEVKKRTFSRIFDNFDNISGIYGKVTYREPSDISVESINDYYGVKKHGSIQKEYTAFTTPIWVRRN